MWKLLKYILWEHAEMTYFLPMGERVKYKRKIKQEQIWGGDF